MLVLVTKTVTETYEDRPEPEGGPARQKYVQPFSAVDIVRIPGAVHALASSELVIMVYEGQGTTLHGVSAGVAIDTLSYDVTITLLQPMSGRVVLLA